MVARSTGPPAHSGSCSPTAASVGRADRSQACPADHGLSGGVLVRRPGIPAVLSPVLARM
jgi:hypothetical protein